MKIYNINCKQYDRYGFCKKKPKRFILFKQECIEVSKFGSNCDIAERYYPPNHMPVTPPKKP